MNGRALRAEDPGEEAEPPAAWPRLGEIAVPTLVMAGRLDAEDVQPINEHAVGLIPGAQFTYLEGVAHLPISRGTERRSNAIARFVERLSV